MGTLSSQELVINKNNAGRSRFPRLTEKLPQDRLNAKVYRDYLNAVIETH